jgi:hypothetical protein
MDVRKQCINPTHDVKAVGFLLINPLQELPDLSQNAPQLSFG